MRKAKEADAERYKAVLLDLVEDYNSAKKAEGTARHALKRCELAVSLAYSALTVFRRVIEAKGIKVEVPHNRDGKEVVGELPPSPPNALGIRDGIDFVLSVSDAPLTPKEIFDALKGQYAEKLRTPPASARSIGSMLLLYAEALGWKRAPQVDGMPIRWMKEKEVNRPE